MIQTTKFKHHACDLILHVMSDYLYHMIAQPQSDGRITYGQVFISSEIEDDGGYKVQEYSVLKFNDVVSLHGTPSVTRVITIAPCNPPVITKHVPNI